MTTSFPRESAKIYEFPARFRVAAEGRRTDRSVDLLAEKLPKVAFGSGWYHEAAVQEADRTRKP